jgi:hypothetical protein
MQQIEQRPIFVVDKRTVIAIGAVTGAVIGATAAFVYTRVDASSRASGLGKVQIIGRHIDSTDYVKLGVALIGLVRLVAGMIKAI